MVVEAVVKALLAVASFIVGLLPKMDFEMLSGNEFFKVLSTFLYFFPMDLWLFVIGNMLLMITVSLGYAIIEWVYKKIPGVD